MNAVPGYRAAKRRLVAPTAKIHNLDWLLRALDLKMLRSLTAFCPRMLVNRELP
jgi:hypothetical protein